MTLGANPTQEATLTRSGGHARSKHPDGTG